MTDTPPHDPRGTPVDAEDIETGAVTSTRWQPEVQYAWSAGPAMNRFLAELEDGNIVGRKCNACGRVIVPPQMFCSYCYRPTDEWVEVEDTGIVETYSISYVDPDANPIEDPILVGVIDIDGASATHGFMHYFEEVDAEEMERGMPVEAKWKPESERVGSVLDIEYFRPR
ncbi:MAG: Zn-ribbon domain-containing OB-fold protein [Halodesulfurarchaeum sp.]